jgi:hypothetical protein
MSFGYCCRPVIPAPERRLRLVQSPEHIEYECCTVCLVADCLSTYSVESVKKVGLPFPADPESLASHRATLKVQSKQGYKKVRLTSKNLFAYCHISLLDFCEEVEAVDFSSYSPYFSHRQSRLW